MGLEGIAKVYLLYLTSPEHFYQYASITQLRSRFDHERLIPHRYLSYFPKPGFEKLGNRHNSLGYRGDEIETPKPPDRYRVVCIGGSTTYCDGVDDYQKSYPYLLQSYFHEQGFSNIDVVNAGVPGYSTMESLINFSIRVSDLKPNLIIIYHGINDIYARLVWPSAAYRRDHSGATGYPPLFQMPPLYEYIDVLRIILIRFGMIEPHNSLMRSIGDTPNTSFDKLFMSQKSNKTYPAGIFREVPAQVMLDTNKPVYFEQNLRDLITLAKHNDVDVVLTTFTYSPFIVDESHPTHPEVPTALAEHNTLIKQIAQSTDLYFFDFKARMPRTADYFTDGYHFTFEGNALRAKLFFEFIRSHIFSKK